MDASERYELGTFDSAEAAVAACKALVDQCLKDLYQPGMAEHELYDQYKSFEEDPLIVARGYSLGIFRLGVREGARW